MHKRITDQSYEKVSDTISWLDLQHVVQVELTSEEEAHPIESALIPGTGPGWRATHAGEQTIRLLFDEPQRIRRIQLLFNEDQQSRTQEFVLRWLSEGDNSYREILRQQYNFSPQGVTQEFEDYTVNLAGVKALELKIIPDISGGDACASLTQLRIASLD